MLSVSLDVFGDMYFTEEKSFSGTVVHFIPTYLLCANFFSTKGILSKKFETNDWLIITACGLHVLYIEHVMSGGPRHRIRILRAHFNQLFKSHLESV